MSGRSAIPHIWGSQEVCCVRGTVSRSCSNHSEHGATSPYPWMAVMELFLLVRHPDSVTGPYTNAVMQYDVLYVDI